MPENCASMILVCTPRSLANQSMKSMSKPTMLPLPSSDSKGEYGSEVQTVSVLWSFKVALAAARSASASASGAGPVVPTLDTAAEDDASVPSEPDAADDSEPMADDSEPMAEDSEPMADDSEPMAEDSEPMAADVPAAADVVAAEVLPESSELPQAESTSAPVRDTASRAAARRRRVVVCATRFSR